MSIEGNKAAVRRLLLEGWVNFDSDIIASLTTPDMLDHAAAEGMPPGREGYFGTLGLYHATVSDWNITISAQVAEDSLVASLVNITACHTGEGLGVPPTGNVVSVDLLMLHRFEDGRVAEEWAQFDTFAFLSALGAIPG